MSKFKTFFGAMLLVISAPLTAHTGALHSDAILVAPSAMTLQVADQSAWQTLGVPSQGHIEQPAMDVAGTCLIRGRRPRCDSNGCRVEDYCILGI